MPDVINMDAARASPVSNVHQNPPIGVINGRGIPQGSRLQPKKLVREWKIRAGIWIVGTLMGRLREIVDVMERRKIDVLRLQETKWKGNETRAIEIGYRLYYIGRN
ncbi:uncharacterized protein [Palaemon carinicauda]|uniref:uncharacterized protein n=1 Tax=Palaemon carinicauda TaxID=392227 RepID=UPI0035B5A0A2